jgi:hypothetical protein
MNSTLSIYIPRMAAHHDEESVKNVMTNYGIGTVNYVDFTPINKKPGFGEKVDDVVKSAFVHFSDPMMSSFDNNYHYNSRRTLGNENFWNIVLYRDGPYKLQISLGEYWLCLENKNPVQRTMMNIHQVVENSRHLENLIEEQSETIKKLENKLENVQAVISKLLSGLFNHKSQYEVLENYNDILFLGLNEIDEPDYYRNWENCPTTRQGDDSERRIEALEQTVRDMLNFDCSEAVFIPQEDELSVSTHSSMPELIDIDSVSTHSSMPDLEEVSVASEERVRNSFELCGNE